MSWTRVSAVLPAVLAACAKVSTVAVDVPDAGDEQPSVAAVDPQPGPVAAEAKFTVQFSVPIDEGALLAATGRSETVVLAAEADVERAAAAIEHAGLSAHERTLLVSAAADIASDRTSVTLTPDQPLPAGVFYLLISPRLKDDQGRKLQGNGARFEFTVAQRPLLLSPAAGASAPSNLSVVRASAASGHLSLLAADGTELAAADAHGEVALPLAAPLVAGARYSLALDGAIDDTQSFIASPCARSAAPTFQTAQPAVTDTSIDVHVTLDWPALVEVRLGDAADGEPCTGACVSATQRIDCAPPVCGPQSFTCSGVVHIDGLKPASAYALRVFADDDEGHSAASPLSQFSTLAPLPRMLITEVMTAPSDGEYVELLNLGPGAADLGALGLQDATAVTRALLATAPPLPLLLQPGERALAVGASFDASLYPLLPPGTPVLRAAAQRLLGRGLSDSDPQAFQLVQQGAVLSRFSASLPACASGTSLQRDESVPPDGEAAWACGKEGGTPGMAP